MTSTQVNSVYDDSKDVIEERPACSTDIVHGTYYLLIQWSICDLFMEPIFSSMQFAPIISLCKKIMANK